MVNYHPTWLGYEPPELVGSTDTSVAKSKPEVIQEVVRIAEGKTKVLVGAGVRELLDVEISLKRGAVAVGVASAVVKAVDQEMVLSILASGFSKS